VTRRAGRRVAAIAAAFGLGFALIGAPGVASAAGRADFGAISATATFEQGIDVTEPVTISAQVARAEVLVTTGSSADASVADVTAPATGATRLSYHLATPSGAIIPNTPVHARFRLTFADGSQETGPEATVRYQDTRFTWQTFRGTSVTVHWIQGDAAFGKRAAAIGDKAIADASALLGVHETDPIDFFVYPDVASFREVIGPSLRENVGGVAFPDIRTLFAQISPDELNAAWVGIVVPHELTHLVFGTATANSYHLPPHWLNEGLAVYLSQGFDSSDRSAVSNAASDGTLMPLTSLDGQFPTAGDRFGLAYSEAVSSIDFMVSTYGKPALVQLIVSYAQGRTDDEAFQAALGVDVAGFEAAWVKDLGAVEPVAVGPKPAPAGALPPGWTAAGGGGATGSAAPGSTAAAGPDGSGGTGGEGGGAVIVVAIVGVVVIVAGIVFASRRARRGQPPPVGPA
jgi:hypothetical protein